VIAIYQTLPTMNNGSCARKLIKPPTGGRILARIAVSAGLAHVSHVLPRFLLLRRSFFFSTLRELKIHGLTSDTSDSTGGATDGDAHLGHIEHTFIIPDGPNSASHGGHDQGPAGT
jgi:hypothetical protein